MGAARIGRIRLKDGAEIVPIRQGVMIREDRKSAFLSHVGQCFDSYVGARGENPDAIVLVFGGVKQSAEAYWTIRGNSQGGGTSMLSLAAATITREIVDPS